MTIPFFKQKNLRAYFDHFFGAVVGYSKKTFYNMVLASSFGTFRCYMLSWMGSCFVRCDTDLALVADGLRFLKQKSLHTPNLFQLQTFL
jgi:hypothetical protein